ncbi:unnamed protein product [Clonostachys rosea]|uniref:Major facilitator superfamily (MFS) profile domain-containing protein n=1 Tax=Bionectria ochroleuca TaxID=29856 RepID=A0ABY6TTK3_BIOOC|nr:unnamed protein product [Clonostachys rosea]
MSLAQHVTQEEGFDYQLPTDHDSHNGHSIEQRVASVDVGEENLTEWRRMSFSPGDFKPQSQPHTAAYKVSDWKRGVQVATAVLANWFASGIVFGFAALKPILVAEGVYRDSCDDGGHDGPEAFAHLSSRYIPCPNQDMRLNFIFITATITTNIACLLSGFTLDRFGRRPCWIIGCIALAMGSSLMAASFANPGLNGYVTGSMLLGLGGTFLFVPSFELANAFPKYSGLVVAVITGAFDASASVFLFYRLACEASEGRFSPQQFFLAYLLVPATILVAELLIMPPHSYHTTAELAAKIEKVQDETRDVHSADGEVADNNPLVRVQSARSDRRTKLDQIEEIVGDAQHREARVRAEGERQGNSGVWGMLHGMPAHRQMRTPWYILILLLTVLQMVRMNYFIATIRSQYRYMLGSEERGQQINQFFDAALPMGGVLSTPFIGLLLNNVSVPTTFSILTVLMAVIGVFNCIPSIWAGYVTVVTFVIFRPLYYSAISDYATKVFGFATFGRIYGTLICFSGVVNFAQSGLDALTNGPLGGDPTPVNAVSAGLGTIIGIATTAFVTVKSMRLCETRTNAGEEEAESLLAEGTGGYGTGEETHRH